MRPTKTKISLHHRAVWPESSLPAWRNVAFSAILNAPSEDSYQTARSLIWIFAGHSCLKVRFLTLWFKYLRYVRYIFIFQQRFFVSIPAYTRTTCRQVIKSKACHAQREKTTLIETARPSSAFVLTYSYQDLLCSSIHSTAYTMIL